MSDLNEKLRDRAIQVAQLNQKVQSLEAQLSGSYGRANELKTRVTTLETEVTEKNNEINMLRGEVKKYKDALDSVGHEIQSMKAEQSQVLSTKRSGGDEYSLKQQLVESEQMLESLRRDLKKLSSAASAVINDESGAQARLKEIVMEIGDPKYRILNMVLEKRKVRLDEIAAILVTDTTHALQICESLQNEGEIEIRDGTSIIPAKKYREIEAPTGEWKTATSSQIFDSLEDIVGRTEGGESVSKALEAAAEILEQKMSRGGALMFEIRRTATDWKKQEGDKEELKYKIRDWKSRAENMA